MIKKRLLTILLIAAMLAGLCVPALAEDKTLSLVSGSVLAGWYANGDVSIMDLGDVDGTVGDNIHPIEKKEVARRLVLAARAVAYDDETARYRFPVVKSMTLKADGSVDVVFNDVYDGLMVKAGDTTVTGFKLKVGDKLVDAIGTITSTDTVNVKADGVLAPSAVWYAYAGAINPELNLFNSAGLSAAPFYAELD